MVNPVKLAEKARQSSFYLWLFNFAISRMIPFNKPHGFRITEIRDFGISTALPYKKSNFNHIKGIHACALATLSEFTTGALLLLKLPPNKYRIILQALEINYHYQAKKDVRASFEISETWMKENVQGPLEKEQSTIVPCEIKIYDRDENHISTSTVHWQLKEWSKVKTTV